MVGALKYVTMIGPNIWFAVSQYMHAPRESHFQVVKHIIRYLVGTIHHSLLLQRHSRIELLAYVDWAGYPDTCCSTSGCCIFLGDNLLY